MKTPKYYQIALKVLELQKNS